MTVLSVRQRLAAIGAEITGVVTSFDVVPRTIQRAELPAFIPFASEAQYDRGSDTLIEQRVWRCVLFVGEVTDDVHSYGEELAHQYIDRLRDAFAGRPGLELTTDPNGLSVYNAIPLGDGGVRAVEFPQGSNNYYYGIEIRVAVEDHIRITYTGSNS